MLPLNLLMYLALLLCPFADTSPPRAETASSTLVTELFCSASTLFLFLSISSFPTGTLRLNFSRLNKKTTRKSSKMILATLFLSMSLMYSFATFVACLLFFTLAIFPLSGKSLDYIVPPIQPFCGYFF